MSHSFAFTEAILDRLVFCSSAVGYVSGTLCCWDFRTRPGECQRRRAIILRSGGVVRLAGAIGRRRQIYNLGTQVDIRGSHWSVRSTHHQQYSVPESVVLPPTAEHHWLDLSRTIATSDRTTSSAQVSRSHMRTRIELGSCAREPVKKMLDEDPPNSASKGWMAVR
jgi:hypothetical protein